jgi:hypothetical protein
VLNCQAMAIANSTRPASTARYSLNRCTRKSDTASPIAVVSSFSTQKYGFTAGTFTPPVTGGPSKTGELVP